MNKPITEPGRRASRIFVRVFVREIFPEGLFFLDSRGGEMVRLFSVSLTHCIIFVIFALLRPEV